MNRICLASILLFALLLPGCRKLELIPMVDNPIWPLQEGNYWTYADTIFAWQDSIPVDTIARSLVYKIERIGYLDNNDENGDLQRFESWEMSVEDDRGVRKVIPIRSESEGVRLSTDVYHQQITGSIQQQGVLGAQAGCATAYDPDLEYWIIKSSVGVTDSSFLVMPIFYHDCETFYAKSEYHQSLGINEGYVWLNEFQIGQNVGLGDLLSKIVSPNENLVLTLVDANAVKTTPAGTFSGLQYDHQFWSEGTGLIEASFEWNYSYNPHDYLPDDYLDAEFDVRLVKKRTLIDFSVQ